VTEPYGEDLAYIHDAGFGDVAAAAAEWLVGELRRIGFASGTVTDLGCGSGILAARLAQAGYSVLGVDVSPAFVEMARRRVPSARFVVDSFVSAELPRSVAIVAVGEVLNYGFDEANGRDAWRALFGRCSAALAPGGIVVCDMAGPSRASAASGAARTVAGPGWSVSASSTVDRSGRVLTRRITTDRVVAGKRRRKHETHRLLLAEAAEVLGALRSAGLQAQTLSSYGGHGLPEGVSVFIGRK
jgi:SAM-dependent methyltransferase